MCASLEGPNYCRSVARILTCYENLWMLCSYIATYTAPPLVLIEINLLNLITKKNNLCQSHKIHNFLFFRMLFRHVLHEKSGPPGAGRLAQRQDLKGGE